MSSVNDLQASHRMLSMLESACEYNEQILDNIPSLFVVLNQDNQVIRANKVFCELVGCSMEDALHRDFAALFSSENRGILLHHLKQLRTQSDHGASLRFKLEIGGTTATRGVKPFYWRLFQLDHSSDAEGQVISLVGDDLSSLYESELKLMSIFGSLPLGLMVIDCEGKIQEVLSEYCHVLLNARTLMGESLAPLLGQHNPELLTELNDAFGVLRDCAGQFVTEFGKSEAMLGRLTQLKIADGSTNKWIRPRFQPIAKNNCIDRYMVILEDVTAGYLAQRQVERADILGKQAQALYECAIRDPLSGLYTRLFMRDSISRLIAAAHRGNLLELTVVMFDLDNFKLVNDNYGHDAGDHVIREFGRIIRTCTRETDISVRYGGEEFVLALPCSDLNDQGGAVVAERIRSRLADAPIKLPDGRTIAVTTSCGVAYCQEGDCLETLIHRADQHLYTAKHSGKNRVCVESIEGE